MENNNIAINNQSAELLDVLNENGVFTGRVATRGEIHKKGLWHRAIIVAIINEDNKILIQRRSMAKEKYPGLWDLSVAGHLPAGRDSISSAATEVMEEIGTMLKRSVQVRDFRFMLSFRSQLVVSEDFLENQFYDFFIYTVSDLNIDELELQENEVSEIKWVTAAELKKLSAQGLMHPRSEWIEILYRYITNF